MEITAGKKLAIKTKSAVGAESAARAARALVDNAAAAFCAVGGVCLYMRACVPAAAAASPQQMTKRTHSPAY
jgi:hypothetical protein